jgi:hypothetical protein
MDDLNDFPEEERVLPNEERDTAILLSVYFLSLLVLMCALSSEHWIVAYFAFLSSELAQMRNKRENML